MRIVIAGGSGLLGGALVARLSAEGHDVVVLSRRVSGGHGRGHREVAWSADGTVGSWARELDGADAVVNLAGAGIADKRWTPARKALLRSSRLGSTHSLVSAVDAAATKPAVFVQGSAVGIYGSTLSDHVHDESSPAGTDFLSQLAVDWEAAAAPAAEVGCRLVVVRTGIVLSRSGGALPPMARPFRMGVGGPIGSGRQYMSWITIDDWVSLVVWAVSTSTVSGIVNATAPAPVTNTLFSKALGRALGRPSLLPVPGFVLRVMFGELAEALLLCGQRVMPTRTQALGFTFAHDNLDNALAHVFRN